MMGILIFSVVATSLVYLAGRKDAANDPGLTTVALILLGVFPLLTSVLPKFDILPASVMTETAVSFSWKPYIFPIWLIGFCVAMLRLITSALTLYKWRKNSFWVENIGKIEIRELPVLHSPVAAGVFRKTIFLPASSRNWQEKTREMILAHHRRHDPLRRWLAGVSCAVNWFNPLVWWVAQRLELQCEYACDASVIAQKINTRDYASLLCDLVEHSTPTAHAISIAHRSTLESRVKRLLSGDIVRKPTFVFSLIACLVVSSAAFSLIDRKKPATEHFSPDEIETRWRANPFPADG